MSAIFNFQSLLTVVILLICTCTYVRGLWPSILDKNKTGMLGIFWKFARIGERLSPYVSICCISMAFTVMFFDSWWKNETDHDEDDDFEARRSQYQMRQSGNDRRFASEGISVNVFKRKIFEQEMKLLMHGEDGASMEKRRWGGLWCWKSGRMRCCLKRWVNLWNVSFCFCFQLLPLWSVVVVVVGPFVARGCCQQRWERMNKLSRLYCRSRSQLFLAVFWISL